MLTRTTAGIRKRPVASAIGSALFIRILLLFWLSPTPHVINLTRGYIETAVALVSHKGVIMPVDDNGTLDVVSFLKAREDIGRRVTSRGYCSRNHVQSLFRDYDTPMSEVSF